MHSLMRRAWVDIDLGALLRNGARVATQAGVPLLPMVKADAYGLGAVRVVFFFGKSSVFLSRFRIHGVGACSGTWIARPASAGSTGVIVSLNLQGAHHGEEKSQEKRQKKEVVK